MGICAVNGCGRGATLRERDEYTAVLLCEEHAAALLSEKPFRHPSARSALEASAVPSTGHVFLNGKCCCGETLPASAVPETRDGLRAALDTPSAKLARAIGRVRMGGGRAVHFFDEDGWQFLLEAVKEARAALAATPPGPDSEEER